MNPRLNTKRILRQPTITGFPLPLEIVDMSFTWIAFNDGSKHVRFVRFVTRNGILPRCVWADWFFYFFGWRSNWRYTFGCYRLNFFLLPWLTCFSLFLSLSTLSRSWVFALSHYRTLLFILEELDSTDVIYSFFPSSLCVLQERIPGYGQLGI